MSDHLVQTAPVLPAEEMLAVLRHFATGLRDFERHARERAERSVDLEWIGEHQSQAVQLAHQAAALEQAIKVLEPSGEIMDRAFEKAARHILDLLVQKEPLTAMRLGSLIGLEIAAREAGKAELARLLRESTQPVAAHGNGPQEEK